jgi:DNA-binding CsgD family transcriptional regulator
MCPAFRIYLEQLEDAGSEQQLYKALASVAGNFDIPLFAYFAPPLRRKLPVRLISNYPPRWATHYFEQGYQESDPVLVQSKAAPLAFDWNGRFANDNAASRRFFGEAWGFGIRFGHTIPIHDKRGLVAAVTFANENGGRAYLASIRRNAEILELIALYFHAYVSRKLGILHAVHLTERERQCLYWASLGKSATDIADMLGLSVRTVKFYLQNVRRKFGVATTIQAAVSYERMLHLHRSAYPIDPAASIIRF